MTQTIKDLTAIINDINSLEELATHTVNADGRKGVQLAISRRRKQLLAKEQLQQKYITMSKYEQSILNQQPNALICGIDEVGRGPLAGPVVACATILNSGHHYLGLDDSKKMTAAKREQLNEALKSNVRDYAFGIATAQEIDELNIYQATKVAMQRAIDNLTVKPTHLLIDAMELNNNIPQQAIIKGDAKSVSIAAASVMAKVYRDHYMTDLAQQYPDYGFDKNAGYGTKQHLTAIDTVGIMAEHRKSFEPIKSIVSNEKVE
ncbi:ribonuclease HII [Staphylococcus simiae]|uniref:ribonuclease HII n=1 Tax=Staphylococcus simiae TaxID=308354 RepID=UPI001A966DD1|nr:ribonuclease HII [Staphylococcus simiae]MBO1199005.1 ribonuclease HII [Staphylococcus simiae]MBO1201273.1 ribonuclease HII [Staphylococcus simiae]MBO1203421.1 ribonuclease HII [Staphylococcus simiae]MBO1210912.1 ribonuclease HII [Staphylococcus simiae]MBO1229574.1 ribonuclease HII [Staphylococcus simiae]